MTRVRYRYTTVYMGFDREVVITYWAAAPRSMDDIEDRISGKCDLQHLCSFHLEILGIFPPCRDTPHSVSSKFSSCPPKHFRHTRILRTHNRFRVKSHDQKICDITEIASTYIPSAILTLSLPTRALLSPSSPVAVHPTVVTATLSLGLIRDSARRPLRAHE